MTRTKTQSPTWRVKARALQRELDQVTAVSEERLKAAVEAWEIIRLERAERAQEAVPEPTGEGQ